MTRTKWAGALAVLILLTQVGAAVAQQQTAKTRGEDRALLWVDFRNTGNQGLRDVGAGYSESKSLAMQYPGGKQGVDGIGFGGDQATVDYGTRVGMRFSNSNGEGVWILAPPGGSFTSYTISASNPRYDTDDIVEMRPDRFFYDPNNGPEKNALPPRNDWVRNSNRANWWPGRPVKDAGDEPVEIVNHAYARYPTKEGQGLSEETIISQWTTRRGITVTRKSRVWSYPDFDDFVIVELVFQNTGDTNGDGRPDGTLPAPQNGVYFTVMNTFSISEAGHLWQGSDHWNARTAQASDDQFRYTEAPNYGASPSEPADGKGLKVCYQWDGDSPLNGWDDTGEPYIPASAYTPFTSVVGWKDKQLLGYQYIGLAPIDAAPPFVGDPETYVAPASPDQPAFTNWWAARSFNDTDQPNRASHTDEQMFKLLTTNAVQPNPSGPAGYTHAQTYGPYNLAPGDRAKLVIVYACGTGAEFAGPGGGPMSIHGWAVGGPPISQVQNGARALFEHVRRARFAYESGYDLPDAPPDVDVRIDNNENANLVLSWSADALDTLNPDYAGAEAKDVAGYRIYKGEGAAATNMGDWTLVADLPTTGALPKDAKFDAAARWVSSKREGEIPADRPGTYSWTDANANAGFRYLYSVRTYARGHTTWTNAAGTKTMADLPAGVQASLKKGLESGFSSPYQRTSGAGVTPSKAASATTDRFEQPVYVVPNPFRVDGAHAYAGDVKIRFLNLPQRCTLRIFNTSGDLIQTLKVDNTTAKLGETTWNGRPFISLQNIVGSGIYYYVVTSEMPESKGKQQIGTFVLIR